MVLNLQKKQDIVVEVSDLAKTALSAVIVDFRGITSDKMTELRRLARKTGVRIQIVRNSLLIRALNGSQFECLKEMFSGPTLIAYSMEHPSFAARLFKEFSKTNLTIKIKGAAFQGNLILPTQIDSLANLPTYEEALIRFIITVKNIIAGKMIRILIAIRDAKSSVSD